VDVYVAEDGNVIDGTVPRFESRSLEVDARQVTFGNRLMERLDKCIRGRPDLVA